MNVRLCYLSLGQRPRHLRTKGIHGVNADHLHGSRLREKEFYRQPTKKAKRATKGKDRGRLLVRSPRGPSVLWARRVRRPKLPRRRDPTSVAFFAQIEPRGPSITWGRAVRRPRSLRGRDPTSVAFFAEIAPRDPTSVAFFAEIAPRGAAWVDLPAVVRAAEVPVDLPVLAPSTIESSTIEAPTSEVPAVDAPVIEAPTADASAVVPGPSTKQS